MATSNPIQMLSIDLCDRCSPLTFMGREESFRDGLFSSVTLRPCKNPDGTFVMLGAVQNYLPIRCDLSGIKWVVESDAGSRIDAGVTDRRGCFVVGRKNGLKHEVAYRILFPQDVRRHIGVTKLGSIARSYAVGFASGLTPHVQEPTAVPVMVISNGGKLLVIRVPVDNSDNITFPYRLAILQHRTETGYTGKKLFFVRFNKKTRMYQADVVLDSPVSPGDQDSIDVWIVSDAPDTSSNGPTVDIDKLDELLKDAAVKVDSDLNAGLMSLKKALETR